MILNGRDLIQILPLSDLYNAHNEHRRLTVFVNKGRRCVICDREGVLLLVTRDKQGKNHIDLYTDDFIMMTVDHTTSKKIGKELGLTREQIESLENKEPMCDPCNNKKGCKLITNEQFKEIRLRHGYPQKHKGTEIIRQLVHNEGIFNRNLEGVVCTST